MRYAAIITAIIFSTAMLSGCSETDHVHDKKYLRAISLDGDEHKKAVFAFYTEEDKVIHAEGDSIEAAGKAAELECGKEFFTGHTELVILNDCDYKETLEFLLNDWKVSPSCLIVYGGEDCSEILKNNSAEELADSVKTAAEQEKAPECDIVTVLSGLFGESGSAEVAALDKDGVEGIYTLK